MEETIILVFFYKKSRQVDSCTVDQLSLASPYSTCTMPHQATAHHIAQCCKPWTPTRPAYPRPAHTVPARSTRPTSYGHPVPPVAPRAISRILPSTLHRTVGHSPSGQADRVYWIAMLTRPKSDFNGIFDQVSAHHGGVWYKIYLIP